MGTTTTDTTFAVSPDGEYITFMRMSLWKRTDRKASKFDQIRAFLDIVTDEDKDRLWYKVISEIVNEP